MSLVRKIKEAMRRDRLTYSNVGTVRYVQPRGVSLNVITDCHGADKIVASTSGVTFAPGERVLVGSVNGGRQQVIIGKPPAGLQNGHAFPALSTTSALAAIRVIAASPAEIYIGGAGQQVYLIGLNFEDGDIVEAVVSDGGGGYEADPYVTVDGAGAIVSDPGAVSIVVSGDQVVLGFTVTVASGAPLGYHVGYRVSQP